MMFCVMEFTKMWIISDMLVSGQQLKGSCLRIALAKTLIQGSTTYTYKGIFEDLLKLSGVILQSVFLF